MSKGPVRLKFGEGEWPSFIGFYWKREIVIGWKRNCGDRLSLLSGEVQGN